MIMSQDKNAGQSHNMKIDSRCFERVEQFRCLETNLMNQNSIQEEIESRLRVIAIIRCKIFCLAVGYPKLFV